MKEGKFFYNYTAQKANSYDKFAYGIITVGCDDSKDLMDEALSEIQKQSKDNFPDADNINFTAFNKL